MSTPAPVSLIDELMPRFHEVERHALLVHAPPADTCAALRRVDIRRAWIVRALLLLRGIPAALVGRRRPRSHEPLTLETRILCLDTSSCRRFWLYWRVIRPFGGLIRIALLRAVAREVQERTP